jgi:hypothetical protein
MDNKTIGIASLLLDPENPRHDVVTSQREALLAIIVEEKSKLATLAADIAENGLSPLDRVLVIKAGRNSRNYIVVEGNRRIAAVKLLHNPDLADGTEIGAAIKRIAAAAQSPPHEVECAIAGSRDDAKHWMVLRHTGEQDGAGVVPWNALASGRFHARPGSQTAKAITFIDGVQSAYPDNDKIQDALAEIAANRITTLGRLVADPDFRDHLGFEDDNGKLVTHYPVAALEAILERILGDLATHMSVTQLKTKDQRAAYLARIPKPKGTAYQPSAKPLSTGGAATTRGTTIRRPAKPGSPFKDLDVGKLSPRLTDILQELRKLDLTKFPNAAAILTRVLLELSVDDFIAKKGLATDGELKKRIRRCLDTVDPSKRDTKYQGVRAGLSDGTSIFAVATLHGYVHNRNFHPTPTDVRNIVGNLKPFLQAMNDLV